jgi:hypothetical protein
MDVCISLESPANGCQWRFLRRWLLGQEQRASIAPEVRPLQSPVGSNVAPPALHCNEFYDPRAMLYVKPHVRKSDGFSDLNRAPQNSNHRTR